MKKVWFRRKRYGWGWVPASVEGWIVMVAYAIVAVGIFSNISEASYSNRALLVTVILPAIILTVALCIIAYATGEKPRWQWGDRKDS